MSLELQWWLIVYKAMFHMPFNSIQEQYFLHILFSKNNFLILYWSAPSILITKIIKHQLIFVVSACSLSNWEVIVGGIWVGEHLDLHEIWSPKKQTRNIGNMNHEIHLVKVIGKNSRKENLKQEGFFIFYNISSERHCPCSHYWY